MKKNERIYLIREAKEYSFSKTWRRRSQPLKRRAHQIEETEWAKAQGRKPECVQNVSMLSVTAVILSKHLTILRLI